MQIIGHNSVNVHQIPTKLGTDIQLNELFKYTKLQYDRSMCLHFMAGFVMGAKRSRRKSPLTVAAHISEMAGVSFFKFVI